MAEAEDGGGDATMAERGSESRLKQWLLMDAERLVATFILLAIVFAVIVAVSELAPLSLREAVRTSDPVETLFQALVTAIITGVTLVVTLTQLVLSQELGGVGSQRERVSEALEFDEDLEEVIAPEIAPPEPASLLQSIVDASATSAREISNGVASGHEPGVRDRVQELADGIVENASVVSDGLADAEFGTFGVISAALDYSYSEKIQEARRLQNDLAEDLSADVSETLDDLVDQLLFFAAAREHTKTLYFRWELTNLSREILYLAVPALLVSMAGILVLDAPGAARGATLGVDNLVLIVSATATVAVAPFLLLLTYILRIVTVTKRTLAPGPLVLRQTDSSSD